jgi:hypothetical protein
VGISPIFNIPDLYPYMEYETIGSKDQKEIQWEKKMPVAEKPQMEKIVDRRIGKKTRRKTYFEYLVKWKGHPIEDASWVNEVDIQKHGKSVQELMDKSPSIFHREEYDAGASPAKREWRTTQCLVHILK